VLEVDDDHATAELARDERAATVGGEVHMVDAGAAGDVQDGAHAHRVRLAEVQLTVGLGDDDRPPAVGGEVEVVRVQDRDLTAGLSLPGRSAAYTSLAASGGGIRPGFGTVDCACAFAGGRAFGVGVPAGLGAAGWPPPHPASASPAATAAARRAMPPVLARSPGW